MRYGQFELLFSDAVDITQDLNSSAANSAESYMIYFMVYVTFPLAHATHLGLLGSIRFFMPYIIWRSSSILLNAQEVNCLNTVRISS